MKVQNSFLVWALLPLVACSAKDESDDSSDGTAEVEEQGDVDDADSNADADVEMPPTIRIPRMKRTPIPIPMRKTQGEWTRLKKRNPAFQILRWPVCTKASFPSH